MTEQAELFHETLNDALSATVAALGGRKAVGVLLFPGKPADEAGRYLADCLNPDRQHSLHPEALIHLLRLSRERGIHLGMHWLCDEIGYSRPSPIEPEDQVNELQRQFIAAVEVANAFATRLQRITSNVVTMPGVRR